jgi:ornithine carbamoyltransferase
MARVFDHQHVLELAEYASVPVINGLSDAQHPCQAMADVLTIYEHFGHTAGLNVAYIGDGNNVALSLAQACVHFGMNFSIAAPEGYDLSEEMLATAAQIAEREQQQITIEIFRDPAAAAAGADVLYTDTWVSMGQEKELMAREAAFANYQINDALLTHAQPNALVLHCLPAHRGQEITDSVADGPQSGIFQQAENRLHAQKAILLKLILG